MKLLPLLSNTALYTVSILYQVFSQKILYEFILISGKKEVFQIWKFEVLKNVYLDFKVCMLSV